tara:strand:+ start:611 stop:865 length:255 start_codon:yes stop_codon:yes gene_type:complete
MITVQQAADKAYPGLTYDYALPQVFFDSCLINGFDIRGQCVWVYENSIFGSAGPLTRSAAEYFKAQGIEYAQPVKGTLREQAAQ